MVTWTDLLNYTSVLIALVTLVLVITKRKTAN